MAFPVYLGFLSPRASCFSSLASAPCAVVASFWSGSAVERIVLT